MIKRMTEHKATSLKAALVGVIATACFLIAAPPLAAQQGQQGYDAQQGQQPTQPPPANFSDNTLEKFATAKGEVDELQGAYSEELKNVKDPDKAQELQNKYIKKMVAAVEGNDLSIDKYNKIIQAMRSDPELVEKVMEMTN